MDFIPRVQLPTWNILLALLVAAICARPINLPSGEVKPFSGSSAFHSVHDYLIGFGYLPNNNPEISNLRTDEAVRIALTRLQEFAGLDPTGEIDEATLTLMRTKRCGLPDAPYGEGHRKKRFALQGSTWPTHNLTYKVVTYTNHLGLGRTRRAVFDALNKWAEASELSFTETQDDQADLLIEFHSGDHGDGYPFDGPNVVLAHAFFPGPGRGGDIHFDNDEIWVGGPFDHESSSLNAINLVSVAAHEVGHSLGLGHSSDRNALMFPYYSGLDHDVKLNYDDISAIQKLYGVGRIGTPTPAEEADTTVAPRFENDTFEDDLPADAVPDPCHSDINAISRIRNEIFVFKNQYFWRLDEQGYLVEKPVEIERFWYGFNENISHIDAVYGRPNMDRTVFFVGRHYWEFAANVALPGYPKNLTNLGLPDGLEKIDAAFVWDHNSKTYFFSGDQYWRFDETAGTVEHDYPRDIKIWANVPRDVDSAFTDTAGLTYFFKHNRVYRFNNYFMRVETGYPIKINQLWNHCNIDVRNMALVGTNSASAPTVSETGLATLLLILSLPYRFSWRL